MLAVSVAVAATLAPGAYAGKKVSSFFPAGAGGGSLGGELEAPQDVAVNDPSVADAHDGWVYVVDTGNNRVQAFERNAATGEHEFRWAVGRDVIAPDATTDTDLGDVFEKCTTAADCKAGSAGTSSDGPGGEFAQASAIAVDQQTGHLFVRELTPNLRVQELTADGGFVRAFGWNVIAAGATTNVDLGDAFEVCTSSPDCRAAATTGSGGQAGQFGSASLTQANDNIAVMPPGSANAGHVIVGDPGNSRVMEFDPDGGPSATFVRALGWGVDTGVEQFEICTAATACQTPPEGIGSQNGRFGHQRPIHVAIDSRGILYVADRPAVGTPRVMRFDLRLTGDSEGLGSVAQQMLLPFTGITTQPLAMEVDPDSDGAGTADFDRIYIGRSASGIDEYDVSSTTQPAVLVDTHMDEETTPGAGVVTNPTGLAVNPAIGPSGVLYLSSSSHDRVFVLDEDGNTTPPDVTLDEPSPGAVTVDSAQLTGSINPNGFPAAYVVQLRRSGDADWSTAGAEQQAGAGTSDVPVVADLTGLESNTPYEARIEVRRGFGNGTVHSNVVEFVTDVAVPSVTTYPPNHSGCDSATLAGQINPNGSTTTYAFEYGPTTAYGTSVPAPAGDAGDGGLAREVAERVEGLEPGQTYHARLVAESSEGQGVGADVQFTTRTECPASEGSRAYELVSPADETAGVGAGTWLPGDLGVHPVGMPSRSGERYVVATTHGPTLVDGKFAYANDTAFAQRTPSGWVSHSPFARPNYGYAGNRFAYVEAADEGLSRFTWKANGGRISFFPEMEDWDTEIIPLQMTDWEGRAEVLAPTDPSQGSPGTNSGQRTTYASADGSVMAFTTTRGDQFSGLGPDDPHLGRLPDARATYVDYLPTELADTLIGAGRREPVGVCDGGTAIPARVESSPGTFVQSIQPCQVGGPISEGGASVAEGPAPHERGVPHGDPLSEDGARLFFQSPDMTVDPEACEGAGTSTWCPTQVFVRQDVGGEVHTRWVTRTEVSGQSASLLAGAYFEGATRDGDRVFFRTKSPLTEDDPNGGCGSPCLTGSPSADSWDLYMFDFTDSASDDPGAGDLTRISAGPDGDGDGNVQAGGRGSALRFASDDGDRVYFTSAAPLPGVPTPTSGTSTTPSGTPATDDSTNLYLYDLNRPEGDRYRFVARLPRAAASIAACATTASQSGEPLGVTAGRQAMTSQVNDCVDGSPDGSVVAFMTDGPLVAGDPDADSGDVYAYDAVADALHRVSAPRDGMRSPYDCATHSPAGQLATPLRCWGDTGIGDAPLPRLGVVTRPSGETSVFFQSKTQLVSGDGDSAYDVYEWRAGELRLMTAGTPTGAYFTGSSLDGEDVFFMTRDALSWQDTDTTMDVYDARIGGGFQAPPGATGCDALADDCQPPGSAATPLQEQTAAPAREGNVDSGARRVLALRSLSLAQRRRAARLGVIVLTVRVSRPGVVRLVARARVGGRTRVVSRRAKRLSKAGTTRVALRLNRPARRRLREGRALSLSVQARSRGARPTSLRMSLRRAGR
jgi:hypothetical protein